MPRPRKRRQVRGIPNVNYFKPAGVPLNSLNEIILTIEEYEVLRLCDVLDNSQEEAAEKMKVSQPTLFRLLKSARTKISSAIVNGDAIKIEGGVFEVKKND